MVATPFASFVPATPSALVREITPRVVRVVRAVLGAAHPEIDDVVQQSLLAFVQALPAFRGECEPGRFAARIAARTAIHAAQRTRVARARRDDEADVDALSVSETQPAEDAARARRMEAIRDLLARIPAEQAETVVLRIMLSWTLPEVAEATGVPVNTVRSRVRLAKNALRAAIEADPTLADELDVRSPSESR
jgi:RNA polymerase sigma-70 factor (ECF subfamily)